uniref:Glycosyltransferase family 92 protein n=1 Tax=Ditylenchus dipsaci TaxID=166011 RepID=A0A915DSF8_9BILA
MVKSTEDIIAILSKGLKKFTGPGNIANSPLVHDLSLFGYKSIGVKKVKFFSTDLLMDVIYAFHHLWRHWTLAFDFVFFNRKSVDFLKQALSIPNVWTCSILKLHQNYYNHPGVYECDQFHVTSLQNQQDLNSHILYLHSIPPKKHGKLSVCVEDVGYYQLPFERIFESMCEAFSRAPKAQPFRLVVEDTNVPYGVSRLNRQRWKTYALKNVWNYNLAV